MAKIIKIMSVTGLAVTLFCAVYFYMQLSNKTSGKAAQSFTGVAEQKPGTSPAVTIGNWGLTPQAPGDTIHKTVLRYESGDSTYFTIVNTQTGNHILDGMQAGKGSFVWIDTVNGAGRLYLFIRKNGSPKFGSFYKLNKDSLTPKALFEYAEIFSMDSLRSDEGTGLIFYDSLRRKTKDAGFKASFKVILLNPPHNEFIISYEKINEPEKVTPPAPKPEMHRPRR